MGARVTHLCSKCGYSAEVSGQPDGGLESATNTFACLDCKELFDLTTGSHGLKKIRKRTPRCPNNKEHTLKPWTSDDPCPKCGAAMEARPDLGCSLWD